MSSPLPPPDVDFVRLQEELLAVQHTLSLRLRAYADDPRVDFMGDGASIDALRDRRDALLLRWARAGLSHLLKGGDILLQSAAVPLAEPPAHPEPVRSEPPPSMAPAPAQPEPRPTPSPAPPADPRALARLASGGLNPSWTRAESTRPDPEAERASEASQDSLLDAIRKELEPIPNLPVDRSAAGEEIRNLDAACALMDHWPLLAQPIQQALVGHVVARARRLQDDTDRDLLGDSQADALDGLFRLLTGYSKREQPGFVVGLMRSHLPKMGSWEHDARYWWDTIDTLTGREPKENPERALARLEAVIADDPEPDAFVEAVGAVLILV